MSEGFHSPGSSDEQRCERCGSRIFDDPRDNCGHVEQRVERSYSWVNPRDYGDDGLAIETGDHWPDDGEILVPRSLYDTAISERDRFDEEAERLGVRAAEAELDLKRAISERDEWKRQYGVLYRDLGRSETKRQAARAELERAISERDDHREGRKLNYEYACRWRDELIEAEAEATRLRSELARLTDGDWIDDAACHDRMCSYRAEAGLRDEECSANPSRCRGKAEELARLRSELGQAREAIERHRSDLYRAGQGHTSADQTLYDTLANLSPKDRG